MLNKPVRIPAPTASQRNPTTMHHRKTEFEPRATLRGRDSAVWVVVSASLLVLVMAGPALRAGDEKAAREESPAGRLDREYREQVRPVIQRFCLKCHSSEEPEAVCSPPEIRVAG